MVRLCLFAHRTAIIYFYPRLCALHNKVNKRLKKPEFDCAKLSSEYDCGCGDDPLDVTSTTTNADNTQQLDPMDLEHDPTKDDITGAELIKGGR